MKLAMNNKVTVYDRLAIVKDAVELQPRISERLHSLFQIMPRDEAGNPRDAYYYLHASDAPEAKAILERYYSIPKTSRRSLSIEVFATAAKVPALKVLEVIFGTAARIAQEQTMVATALASIAQTEVVESAIASSKFPGEVGFADRQLLAKITGLLPQPKGPSTKITVTTSSNANATAAVVGTPPPEAMIRRLADRFNEHRSTQVIDVPPQHDVEGGPGEDV